MLLNRVDIFINLFIPIFFTIASLFEKSWYFCQPFWKFTQSARNNTITISCLLSGLLPLLRPSKKSLTASDELKKLTRQKFYWQEWGFGAFLLLKCKRKKENILLIQCFCRLFNYMLFVYVGVLVYNVSNIFLLVFVGVVVLLFFGAIFYFRFF